MNEHNSIEFEEDFHIFLAEVDELLGNTEENLVELEKCPSDNALIQEVFRAMHTIKGGAATLGLQDGVEVTHIMESILENVRSGSEELTSEMVDVLFAVLDWLEEWKDALDAQGERPSTQEVMRQINEFRSSQSKGEGKDEEEAEDEQEVKDEEGKDKTQGQGEDKDKDRVRSESASENACKGLDTYLTKKLHEYLDQGKPVHKLTVKFSSSTDLLSVRCFQALILINEVAEVVGSVPSLEEVESDVASDVLYIYVTCDDGGMEAKTVVGNIQDVVQVTVTSYDKTGLEQLAPYQPGQSKQLGRSSQPCPPEQPDQSGLPDKPCKPERPGPKQRTHETRTPPSSETVVRKTNLGRTVRVDVSLLDFLLNMVGELVIDRTRLTQIAARLQARDETVVVGNELAALSSHLQRTSQELQEGIMRARLLPLNNIFTKFPRMIRDLSNRCGKKIDLETDGEDTELDRTVLEAIDDPLIHILRNAVDHGIEMPEERRAKGKPERGKITLSAWYQENQVLVQVRDDGSGIDPENVKQSAIRKGLITQEAAGKLSRREAVELIFMPGFSTSQVATQVSGRGVGMDVVRSNLERINGHIEVRSVVGMGTSVTLRLPLTLAIMRALLVDCSGIVYAIPTSSVEQVIVVNQDRIQTIKGKAALTVRGTIFPLVSLEGCLKDDPWLNNGRFRYAVLTRSDEEPLALGVDGLIGEEEIVVKEMGRILSRLKGIAGATILPEGDPAVILDINRLL